MILVDANLLVYAHVKNFDQHEAARMWLDSKLSGPGRVGIPWPSLLAFVRLVSNPRVFEKPEPISKAWNQVTSWIGAPTVWVPHPTEHHASILSTMIAQCDRPNLIHDAHLAALSIEHGLILCSTDGDFARFTDVRWENPLKKK